MLHVAPSFEIVAKSEIAQTTVIFQFFLLSEKKVIFNLPFVIYTFILLKITIETNNLFRGRLKNELEEFLLRDHFGF